MPEAKTASMVDTSNIADRLDDGSQVLVGDGLDSTELEMSGDGDEERNAIHVHDVGAERDCLISLVYSGWQWGVVDVSSDRMWATAHSLAFEAANIGAENVLRGKYVLLGDRAVGQKVVVHNVDEFTRGRTAYFSL
jgi:hypothetical protein